MKITPVKHFVIHIDEKTYYRIVRVMTISVGGNSDLYFMCDKAHADKFRKKLSEPNEFLRLKCQGEYYMDLTIKNFEITDYCITIRFDRIIDYNTRRFVPKTKAYIPKFKKR